MKIKMILLMTMLFTCLSSFSQSVVVYGNNSRNQRVTVVNNRSDNSYRRVIDCNDCGRVNCGDCNYRDCNDCGHSDCGNCYRVYSDCNGCGYSNCNNCYHRDNRFENRIFFKRNSNRFDYDRNNDCLIRNICDFLQYNRRTKVIITAYYDGGDCDYSINKRRCNEISNILYRNGICDSRIKIRLVYREHQRRNFVDIKAY